MVQARVSMFSEPESKQSRKTLTIIKMVKLLDMLNEWRSYMAVGCHFGLNESTVCYIKKDEKNIRSTAAASFNKNAKRVVTLSNKVEVRIESASSF